MKWYIEANALMDYACNQKDKTITPNDIARFPKADVQEVKHGHWRKTEYAWSICSNCFSTPRMYFPFNYCPYCGAKMDVKEKMDDGGAEF